MEENLTEKDIQFNEYVDSLPVLVIDISPQGILTFVNSKSVDILGYSKDELIGHPFFAFVSPEDRSRCIATARNVMSGTLLADHEFVLLAKDGSKVPAYIHTAAVKNNNGEDGGLRGLVFKLSRDRSIEANIRSSEEKYRSLVNNIKLAVTRTSPQAKGGFIEVNKALEEMTGYSREELLSMGAANLYYDPLERYSMISDAVQYDATIRREIKIKRKDGTVIPVSLILTAVRDPEGNVLYLDAITEDITERKKLEERNAYLYEQEKTQREALQEEIKARGLFLDILAHELRAPLTPIISSAGLLKDLTSASQADIQQKLAANIFNSTEILAKRLEELLDLARFSRGAFKLKYESIHLNLFISAVINRFKPILTQKHQALIEDISPDLPLVEVDPSRLEQVIVNLLSNANKYSGEGKSIILKVSTSDREFEVSVTDQGIGISSEAQIRLFEPYYRVERSKQSMPGLGLGLTISKQIIEAHGGKIWVVSSPEVGSTFAFRIPLKKAETEE
jgi:PAS domain S-box-containing protein